MSVRASRKAPIEVVIPYFLAMYPSRKSVMHASKYVQNAMVAEYWNGKYTRRRIAKSIGSRERVRAFARFIYSLGKAVKL